MDSNLEAIKLSELSYAYKSDWSAKKYQALNNISLSVLKGESFGFLGHNGAGKTTTIKCILGLLKASAGSIEIFGKAHTDPAARKLVGYLPEQAYFYDHLTVYELMEMYARLAGVKEDIPTAIKEALDKVHVSARINDPLRSLSKGLGQRVAMAQAIVAKPSLLILDEPFSGLDPIGRREFKDLLFALKAQGTTIFVSSHILSDIEFLCDRVSIMAHGQIKEVISIAELHKYQSHSYELVLREAEEISEALVKLSIEHEMQEKFLRLKFESETQAKQALKLSLEANICIEDFHVYQGSLEDIFVKLVEFEEAGN